MNRPIKFRGNYLREGKPEDYADRGWVYGFYIIDSGVEAIKAENGVTWDVVPESVGQFTGIQDENGKDIYEGDVVQWTDSYGVPGVGNDIFTVKEEVKYEGAGFTPLWDNGEEMEVIGNIYQNPELMEKK